MIDETILMDTLRQGLWTAVVISAPILAVALIVGLAIGLFQALTSIQEMTLTFIPKIVAVLVVASFTAPYMASQFGLLARLTYDRISTGF